MPSSKGNNAKVVQLSKQLLQSSRNFHNMAMSGYHSRLQQPVNIPGTVMIWKCFAACPQSLHIAQTNMKSSSHYSRDLQSRAPAILVCLALLMSCCCRDNVAKVVEKEYMHGFQDCKKL